MGDIIELTTWQNHKGIYYKITSNCINFDVKTSGPAAVGLATKPRLQWDILVTIGDGDRTMIKKYGNDHVTLTYPNIINREHYKRFWISWTGNFVAFGNSTTKEPLLQYKSKLPDLKYVKFSVVNNGPPVHWRFELPPLFKQPPLKAISNGQLKWVAGSTILPNNAVIGGFDSEFLYIIRAKHKGSLTPGAFIPSKQCAYIPSGGQSHKKTEFEVLCGFDYMWFPTKRDIIPTEAVEAGYSEVLHETLYIGRAFYNGSVIPGKVTPSHKVCYIHCGREERAIENYEILITPHKHKQSVEKVVKPHVSGMVFVPYPFNAYPISSSNSDDESDLITGNYDTDEDEDLVG